MMQVLIVLMAVFALGCGAGKNQTQVDIVQDTMKDQISIKAQDWDPKQPGKQMMLLPPKNTVARNHRAYKITDPLVAGKTLKNPLKGDRSQLVQETGKKYYVIYCGVCHGDKGDGVSPVADKMLVKPPSLISGLVSTYRDGHYYHTVVQGKGVMGPYGGQVRSERQRWAIVNYIRTLQGKN